MRHLLSALAICLFVASGCLGPKDGPCPCHGRFGGGKVAEAVTDAFDQLDNDTKMLSDRSKPDRQQRSRAIQRPD